jgi:ATP-dependent Lhr-like helicase
MSSSSNLLDVLALFHPAVREWFGETFGRPTEPQAKGWPPIARGESTLVLAPTGTGKTLAAFLWCIDRLMFVPVPPRPARCRTLYVSPLKALAVDVERNLRAPLAGIAVKADARGDQYNLPTVAVRTGDTPPAERARLRRVPADILITTPESLYLLLTSGASEILRTVETVIVDEIHALVASKRGAHLALSLERLERLASGPLQRIGLSATQRPLEEVARFLGGAGRSRRAATRRSSGKPVRRTALSDPQDAIRAEFGALESPDGFRPVTIVDAGRRKRLELRVEVPVADMARLGQPVDVTRAPAAGPPARPSIWTAVHPRLVELVRQHRTTIIFVNSRRLAERLASALNELAGETLVRSHHGSIARTQRLEVEDSLKEGRLRGLVATSSLELGIDMGSVDLVVQIEAPPSVTSGMQRIGRASHQVDAASRGVIVPKYRGDLVACAAVTRAMHEGDVEASRYPRNPLDVLAQQIVAMVAMEPWSVDELYDTIRSAAPFSTLTRPIFEGLLDMLAGRYPSDEFAELRPRVTWDRLAGRLETRGGARTVAVVNGGTIPDRGLYGVFLAGAERGSARVGELDEEMVFESREGETFLLGASTWRIEEITHDRVLVSPAPGEPGKMPFWKGDAVGRPVEFGRRIGRLVRDLGELPPAAALDRLVRRHDLDQVAAENLLAYLASQKSAAGAAPDDRTILIERCRDDLGDWRLSVLTPLGGRILAPWSLSVAAKIRDTLGLDVETMWADDGFVVRFPESERPPDERLLIPEPDEVDGLVLRQLGGSALFAAKFREAAGRALLLPRRRPGARAPLWHIRKRAADLLAVAAKFGSFPILLETYRECLRDVFDMPALVETLRQVADRSIRVVTATTDVPSPFASAILFGYVANYIYEGDAPLAERRAQALSIDQAQLSELVGDAELRDLVEPDALEAVERRVQHLLPEQRVRTGDGLHDLLLRMGDLNRAEIDARAEPGVVSQIELLIQRGRVLALSIAGEERYIAVEDASRYRDGIGVPLPAGVPGALLEPVRDPRGDLARRFSRTHGPFTTDEFAARYRLGRGVAEAALRRLLSEGRLVEGEFRPGGLHREWCDPDVLRSIRRQSLARLRREVEPVESSVLGRLLTAWQGVVRPRRGLDALLDVVENLQGAPLPASILESDILPARLADYSAAALDAVLAAGEVVWCGVEPLGDRDGRVALYLTDHLDRLCPPAPVIALPGRPDTGTHSVSSAELDAREAAILAYLSEAGASFFGVIHDRAGGGYPGATIDALWRLVWRGLVTNDSFQPLRAFTSVPARTRGVSGRGSRERPGEAAFRSRRAVPPQGEGRWSLVGSKGTPADSRGRAASHALTHWTAALTTQLLARYGIVSRETAAAEAIPGGFTAIYEVLKRMEETGKIRRGYFVAGVGAAQFGLPGALDLLRALKQAPDVPEIVLLAATDPANPYGAVLPWPALDPSSQPSRGPTRTVGASIVLVNGALVGYLGRGGRVLLAFLSEDEADRTVQARALASTLARVARDEGLLISEVNGTIVGTHPLAPHLIEAGFVASALGYHVRRGTPPGGQPRFGA